MTTFVSNAFSFNMVEEAVISEGFDMLVDQVDVSAVSKVIGNDAKFSMSARATETLFQSLTGVAVTVPRNPIKLTYDDSLLVMQYNGPRIPDGCTAIPVGGSIKFLMVTIKQPVWN